MATSSDTQAREALLQNFETSDVDYKAPTPWKGSSDKRASCELVKDIIAMANSGGGFVIVGVEEPLDGKSYRYSGLTTDDLQTWETTNVNKFLNSYIDPPTSPSIRPIEHNGVWFIVIEVFPFDDLPHMWKREFEGFQPGTLYVRTTSKESARVTSNDELNVLIEKAVRNRHDRLLESMRSILVGATTTSSITATEQFEAQWIEAQERVTALYPAGWPSYIGFRQAVWWPAQFTADRFPLDVLRDAARQAHIDYRGWPFLWFHEGRFPPIVTSDKIETVVASPGKPSEYQEYPIYDYWQLCDSGLFFQSALMQEEYWAIKDHSGSFAYWDETAIYIAEAVDCLGRLCDTLGIHDEEITLDIRMTATEGRYLRAMRGYLNARYTSRSPEVHRRKTYSIEEWRAGRIDIATDITREVLLRFIWPDPPNGSIRQTIERLFDHQLQ